jgi:hypothetical protein
VWLWLGVSGAWISLCSTACTAPQSAGSSTAFAAGRASRSALRLGGRGPPRGRAERPLATGSRLGMPSRTVLASGTASRRAADQKGHRDGSEGLPCPVRTARQGERRPQQGCPDCRPRGALIGRRPRATSRTSRTGSTVSSPVRGGSGLSGLCGFNSCLWGGPPKSVYRI